MKILVYGAGNMGCLYAALLAESGQDVSILARGRRLAEIRERGIHLENAVTGKRISSPVNAVERLEPEDDYDLILVALPRHHVSEALPTLAESRPASNVMFFGNNASGPREMIDALGRDRVLLGFPGAAAIAQDQVLRYLITSALEQPTTIGEIDGIRSPRIEAIADALEAAGFSVAICSNMDAWLKTHVAKISPTANALYMAGVDARRLARTPDALVLMIRAIREAYRVLSANGIPITPSNHKVFQWIPEPLLLVMMRKMVASETIGIKIGHALGARAEMKTIADELRALAAATSVPTPAMDRLYKSVDPSEESMPDGCAELPLDWSGVWWLGAAIAAVAVLIAGLWS